MSAIILYVSRPGKKMDIWFDPGDEETEAAERFMQEHNIRDWVHDEQTMVTTMSTPDGERLEVSYGYMDEAGLIIEGVTPKDV